MQIKFQFKLLKFLTSFMPTLFLYYELYFCQQAPYNLETPREVATLIGKIWLVMIYFRLSHPRFPYQKVFEPYLLS